MIKKLAKKVIPKPIRNILRNDYQWWQQEGWLQLRWYLNLKRIISLYRLYKFKDKHWGERCFIIGNGPSLNKMDLSPLRDEITFGMNRIYLLFPKLGFTTTYFVSVNRLVIKQCANEIVNLPIPKFLSWSALDYMPFTKDIIFLKTIGGTPQFSFDPGKIAWESGTVTYIAMQLAFYMGFQKVILIGVDHNFITKGPANTSIISEGDDPNHFDPNYFGKGFKWQLPDFYHSELGYQLANTVYIKEGREILDATVGGKLKIFPKIDYSKLF